MLSFADHTDSVVTTQLCHCSEKEAKDSVNGWVCLCFNKTLCTKTGGKWIWPGDCTLLIPANSLSVINCHFIHKDIGADYYEIGCEPIAS